MLFVSNYHYIRNNFKSKYPSIFGLTPKMFKRQLLKLKGIGMFVHPDELLTNSEDIFESPQIYFLVTFDDGLKEQYELALPILKQLEVPALFFVNSLNFMEKKVSLVHKIHLLRSVVSPDYMLEKLQGLELTLLEKDKAISHYNYDTEQNALLKYMLNFKLSYKEQISFINTLFPNFFDEEKVVDDLYMNEQQLRVIAESGWLGSHTHSHLPLGDQTEEVIKKELTITKQYLENLTNKEISFVSYPYGNEDACKKPVPKLAEEAGYKVGFTMERGANTNAVQMLTLKRFDCNDLPTGKNEEAFKNEYSTINK